MGLLTGPMGFAIMPSMQSAILWVTGHRRIVLLFVVLGMCLFVAATTTPAKEQAAQGAIPHVHSEFITRAELKANFWYGVAMVVLTNALALGSILMGYGLQRGKVMALELREARASEAIAERNLRVDDKLAALSRQAVVVNTKLSMPDPAVTNLAFHVEQMSTTVKAMRQQLSVLVGDRARQLSDTQMALDKKT